MKRTEQGFDTVTCQRRSLVGANNSTGRTAGTNAEGTAWANERPTKTFASDGSHLFLDDTLTEEATAPLFTSCFLRQIQHLPGCATTTKRLTPSVFWGLVAGSSLGSVETGYGAYRWPRGIAT